MMLLEIDTAEIITLATRATDIILLLRCCDADCSWCRVGPKAFEDWSGGIKLDFCSSEALDT